MSQLITVNKFIISSSGQHDKKIKTFKITKEKALALLKDHANNNPNSKFWYWFDLNNGESFYSNENI